MTQLMAEDKKPQTLEDALEILDELRDDNARYRKKNRELKEKLADFGDDTENVATLKAKVTELETKLSDAESYKTKYEELDVKYQEVNGRAVKSERLAKLTPIFNKLNVTDEKALALALKEIGEDVTEDKYEEAAKAVVEAYPVLATKPAKSVPNTGKSNEGKTPAITNTADKMKQGFTEMLANM